MPKRIRELRPGDRFRHPLPLGRDVLVEVVYRPYLTHAALNVSAVPVHQLEDSTSILGEGVVDVYHNADSSVELVPVDPEPAESYSLVDEEGDMWAWTGVQWEPVWIQGGHYPLLGDGRYTPSSGKRTFESTLQHAASERRTRELNA